MKVSYYFFKRKHFIFNLLPCFFFLVFIGNFYLLLSIMTQFVLVRFLNVFFNVVSNTTKRNQNKSRILFIAFYALLLFSFKKGSFFVQPNFYPQFYVTFIRNSRIISPCVRFILMNKLLYQCYMFLNKFFNKKPMIDQSFAMVTLRQQFYQEK